MPETAWFTCLYQYFDDGISSGEDVTKHALGFGLTCLIRRDAEKRQEKWAVSSSMVDCCGQTWVSVFGGAGQSEQRH